MCCCSHCCLEVRQILPHGLRELVAEVNHLRAAVQELTRERDSLRAGISGEGQPTQTVLAVVPAETRNPADMMATVIEEADTDLRRSQGRVAPY